MPWARIGFRALAWFYVLAVMLQFWLAGFGLPQFGGHSLEPHRILGHVLTIVAIALFLLALASKADKVTIGMTVVLFLLVFLQPIWTDGGVDPKWLNAFHVFDALLIFILSFHIALHRADRAAMPSPA